MERYSKEEVFNATLEYFNNNELPTNVFVDKYALRDREGNFFERTPDDMHHRLAREFARIEKKYPAPLSEDEIYSYLEGFKYIVPQGSPMFGIGNDEQIISLSNCAVVASPEDTMSSIFDSAKNLANLYKRRFGAGLDLGELRPEGTPVRNAAVSSSGAWSFADLYSFVTRLIGQSGRRGALMLTMPVEHPDIFKFVTMKEDLTKVTGANVSVKVSDAFMEAVEADEEFELRWPLTGEPKITKVIRARELFETIADVAVRTGEPGFLFWDTITKNLPLHAYPEFETISTNPCGEIPLSAYDSCRLISINLVNFVEDAFTEDSYFNFDRFERAVAIATRLADDLVDLEIEKLHKIRDAADTDDEIELFNHFIEAAERGRRTGIGTHGLGDALARLGLKYDEAFERIDKIYSILKHQAYRTSIHLADLRGSFPAFDWEVEKDVDFFKSMPEDIMILMKLSGRRNGALLTNAPTGSVSIVSQVGDGYWGTSSGIEPVYMNSYKRKRKVEKDHPNVTYVDPTGDAWEEYTMYHANIYSYLQSMGIGPATIYQLPDYFVTSDEIDWIERVRVQATIQKHIDHSISSTINLPTNASASDVEEIYLEAWETGCKGITVYRDGSRPAQVLSKEERKTINVYPEKVVAEATSFAKKALKQRVRDNSPRTHRGRTTNGDMFKASFTAPSGKERKVYVYIGMNEDGEPVEVFVTDEDGGEELRPYCAATGKLSSIALKWGVPWQEIADALDGLRGASISYSSGIFHSVPDLIAKRLYRVAGNERPPTQTVNLVVNAVVNEKTTEEKDENWTGEECPDCGQATYRRQGGCGECLNCGYSECG